MVALFCADRTRRVVAAPVNGGWTVRLEARDDAGWSTVAELVQASGWPIARGHRRHGIPATEATADQASLRVEGSGTVDAHAWRVVDQYAFEGSTLRLVRSWTHQGDAPQEGLDLLIEARCPTGGTPRFVVPGISYDGNGSADAARLVPRFPDGRPARCLYEEHRCPVPMVTCEWQGRGGRAALSLIALPAQLGRPDDDHWWSLGLSLEEKAAAIVLSSGTVETNGKANMVYGAQGQLIEVEGWPLTAQPGQVFQKQALLECHTAPSAGHGFRLGLWKAHEVFQPAAEPALSLDALIDLKLNALRARYVEADDAAGFLCLPPKNLYGRGPYFLWGWTGQSLRACWSALAEGRRRGKLRLEAKAVRAADFFVSQPLPRRPDRLIALRYLLDEHCWAYDRRDGTEFVSSRQFGEAFANLAALVELGRHLGLVVDRWMERLEWATDFLADPAHRSPDGLLPHAWTRRGEAIDGPPSAAGAPCICALARAGMFTATDRYRVAARELLAGYHKTFLDHFDCHPWGSTLDARCEDKEASLYLLAAALDAYESIGEGRFLDWARAAADWALTFYFVWDVPFPEGKPLHGKVRTTGWPTVSVQNHHLDVFAAPSLFVRLSQHTGDRRYARFAQTMAKAITQSVATKRSPWGFNRPECQSVAGEQGEALFHTNYWQGRGSSADWRGGCNTWDPSWVCFHVLAEAILLRDAGLGW